MTDRRQTPRRTVDQRLDAVEDRFRRWFVRGLIAYSIIALASFFALLGYGLENRDQNARAIELCEAINIRHDNAITALKVGSDLDQSNAPDEKAKAEIRRRRDVTITLIDAVTPKTNCVNPVKPKRLVAPK